MRPRSVSRALSGAPSTQVLTPFVVRSVLRTSLTPHLRSEGGCQVGPVRLGTFGCPVSGSRSDVESSTETTTSVRSGPSAA